MTRFTAIDFETADYGRDSACAVALVVVVDGEILYSIDQLIRPPRPDFRFTHIHGLTWDHVAQSPTFAEIWPSLARMIEGSEFLVAHNAAFDKGVLSKCCAAAGLELPEQRFACTVKAARRTWKLPSYKLNILADHLGIPLKHHDARSDAEACAKIAVEAMRLGTAL
ncbi:3'-5' exonuclease [Aestuariispira insulae]|uniref:DNA polymerase-3 subunit epsilon n=1 Tax=Aestuariispira insulae TaxID=1461337 RepID=A0A3D9HGC8_9PROT|nr:3'-5' exonuclease [Aestuariispira insulae]RED48538.1 DNA polymerase-3 subunit epsilon [Aestuariispira insulae]